MISGYNIEDKLLQLKQLVAELGKEQALLKLSKQWPKEELSFLMDQLNGRELAEHKFPFLASRSDIVYPPSYYLEQTSSERTARFKASLVSGHSLIDMTGGFGIDTYFFSQKMEETWYVEQDLEIYNIASANLQQLNPAIKTFCGDSTAFLRTLGKKVDWLYLDPLRRNKNVRLNSVEEYSPNIYSLREELFEHADRVMIKLSPMTDIHQLARSFNNQVDHVYVVAVDNECKELLITSDGKEHQYPLIESIHWHKEREERFTSSMNRDRHALPLSDPMDYLYEPNAAVFKAQQYDDLAAKYSLNKLHPNTHLYTSANLHHDYEGRIYKVTGVYAFDSKELKRAHTDPAFNIKTRNFPLDPSAVAKKLRIKEGGQKFLFCIRAKDEKLRVVVCERIPVN